MSTIPVHGPEERWRRTVDQRGRPLKLKVGRLLKEFGYVRLEPGVGEAIEARLAEVGLHVRPTLRNATADQVIMLELLSAGGAPAAAEPQVLDEQPFSAPRAQPFERAPERAFERAPQPAQASAPAYEQQRPQPPSYEPAPAPQRRHEVAPDDMEQSVLVRAAVEAERRVRTAYDRAAAAASERIAGLERELVAERESTARARDERDELERRMHIERREAAARLQALAAAERTARGLLESQRTELSNLTQTVRVTTAAIAQTRETLGDVHEQVRQTAADVRDALTESANDEPVVTFAEREQQLQPFTMEDVVDVDGDEDDAPAPAAELPAADEDPREPDGHDHDHDHAGHDHDHAAHDHEHDHAGHDHDHAGSAHADDDLAPHDHGVGQFFEPADSASQPAAERRGDRRSGRRAGRGRGERLRRRPAFVCAVCGRPGKTRDAAELVEAGWRVEGDVALCVTCVADDWKLAEGETVPFRSRT